MKTSEIVIGETYRTTGRDTVWRPDVLRPQQIDVTFAAYEAQLKRDLAARNALAEQRQREAREERDLRARVVALTADMDTHGSLGTIAIGRGELRHLLKLAESALRIPA